MLRTKKDVDRHVKELLAKIKPENERKLRGYNIARLYFNIKEYESARRYLSEFITVRPKAPDAHRLLGEIYKGLGQLNKAVNAYKTSYDLDLLQKDLILKICGIYSEIDCDESTRLYWLEEGERYFPHDETLVRYKEKLFLKTRSKSKEDLEKLYLDEIKLNPNSENIHLSLLKLYQEWSEESPVKIEQAYHFARKTESSNPFVECSEWYIAAASVIESYESWKKPDRDKELEEYSLIILDRLTRCTLARCCTSSFNLSSAISEAQNALKKFDERLNKASKILSLGKNCLLGHMIGQLYFHMACLIMIRKNAVGLLNTDIATGALFIHSILNATDTNVNCHLYRKTLAGSAAYRSSQSSHVLSRLVRDNEGQYSFLEKIREEISKREYLKSLYILAFESLPRVTTASFFLAIENFAQIDLCLPEKSHLLLWDQEVCINMCTDLKEMLWVFMQNGLSAHSLPVLNRDSSQCPISDYSSILSFRIFKDLPYARGLADVAPESLSYLDLLAFIAATAFCIEEKLDQPSLLSGNLHSAEQEEFWNATVALITNSSHKRLNRYRSVLQSGLESIRVLGRSNVPLPLAVHLARIFAHCIESAKKSSLTESQIRGLMERAEHYWKRVLSLCDRAGSYSSQLGNKSKSSLFHMSWSRSMDFKLEDIQEEANYFIAERYAIKGRKQEAIQMLSQLKTHEASFKLALLYKQCAFENLNQRGGIAHSLGGMSNSQDDYKSYLYKSRDTLYLTLDRTRMPGVKASPTINQKLSETLSQVESAIADMTVQGHDDSYQQHMPQGDEAAYNGSNLSFSHSADLTNGHVAGLAKIGPQHSSTPFRESTPTRSIRRQEARPSPERLDAQVRHLTDVQENTIKTMQEHILALRTQNETLLDTCQTMVAEFKENVSFYKNILDQKKSLGEYFVPVNAQLQHLQDMMKDLQIEVRSLSGDVADLRTLRFSDKEDPKQDSLVSETPSQVPLDMANSAAMQGLYNNYHSYYGGHQPHIPPSALLPPSAIFNNCQQPPFAPPSSIQSQPYMSSPGVVKPDATLASPLYQSSPYQFSASMAAVTTGLALSSSMKTANSRADPLAATAPHAFQIAMPPQSSLAYNNPPGPADSPKPAVATEGLLCNVPAPLYSAVVTLPSPPKASEKNVLISSLKSVSTTPIATAAIAPIVTPTTPSLPQTVIPRTLQSAASKEASPAPVAKPSPLALLSDAIKPSVSVTPIPKPETTTAASTTSLFATLSFKGIGAASSDSSSKSFPAPSFNLPPASSSQSSLFGTTVGTSNVSSSTSSLFANTSNTVSFASLATSQDSSKSLFATKDETSFTPTSIFSSVPSGGDSSPQKDQSNTSKDEVEEYEPQVDFVPVIPMPALVDVKTGEEEEEATFCERSKLFRYDASTKEWKERGIGDLKILKNTKTEKVRVLMRRDQTHKVCANHFISVDMTLSLMASSDRAWVWAASDFADEEVKQEKFAGKFKTPEIATNFKKCFEDAQNYLKTLPTPLSKPEKNQTQNEQKTALSAEKPKNTSNLAQLFKPAEGSWECQMCLVRNKPMTTSCAACQTPKPGSSAPSNDPVPQEKPKNSATSLAQLFKPAQGSWECPTCLVRNMATATSCASCQETKPGSSPATQEKSSTNSTESPFSAPAFKFGASTPTSTFTFGVPKTETPKPAAFTFGTPTASTPSASFSFGLPETSAAPSADSKPTQSTASGVFSFSWKPPATSTSTPVSAPEAITTVSSTTPAFPSFGVSTPLKEATTTTSTTTGNFEFTFSPPKQTVGFKSPRSRDVSTCESEDGSVDAGEGEHLYFEPVIPLPDKIDVVTGEEDETVLYVHRAKLFRHDKVTSEWKERGIGNLKILQHNRTKKIRLLMRRENIHKICLNHLLSLDLVFQKKDDQSLCWVAQDYSDNEPNKETFAIRFKNSDIVSGFVQALNDARVKMGGSPLDLEFPKMMPQSPSPVKETKNGPATSITSPSIFSVFGDAAKQSIKNVEKAEADSTSDVELVYQRKATEEQVRKARSLKLPDNFYLYEDCPPCPGCIGCQDGHEQKEFKKPEISFLAKKNQENIETPVKSEQTITEGFFTPASTVSKQPIEIFKTPSSTQKSLFGGGSPIFGNTTNSFASVFNKSGGSIFGNTAATTTASSSPSFSSSNIFSNTNMTSFKDLMPPTTEGGLFNQKPANSNSDVWKPQAVFGMKSPDKDDSVTDDDYDPHYDPVIAMPDIVEVKTGEEGWQDLFSERSKVFRFDPNTKEWKERGIGNFKIQYEPTVNKYRLLQRREQVYKLSCNHIISPAMSLSPMMSSEVAYCWSATDFSENPEGEYMKLAVKFKNKEIADRFKASFEECQNKILNQSEALHLPTTVVTASVPSGPSSRHPTDNKAGTGGDEEDGEIEDEEEEDDLDEEEEDGPYFYDSCFLSKMKINERWQEIGEVDLRLHYDSDAYGIRVSAARPDGECVADHLICIQSVFSPIDATTATWMALDTVYDPPSKYWFKAKFSCSEALTLFKEGFKEGKECAEHADLEESLTLYNNQDYTRDSD